MLRISVSNEPELDNWEIVLEDSFAKKGQADILEFPLSSSVTDKRFIKLEIITHGNYQGCIQFFDVVRNAANEKKSGYRVIYYYPSCTHT